MSNKAAKTMSMHMINRWMVLIAEKAGWLTCVNGSIVQAYLASHNDGSANTTHFTAESNVPSRNVSVNLDRFIEQFICAFQTDDPAERKRIASVFAKLLQEALRYNDLAACVRTAIEASESVNFEGENIRVLSTSLVGHAGTVTALAASNVNGRPLIISGSEDATIRLWDLKQRRPLSIAVNRRGVGVSALAVTEIKGRPVIVSGGYDNAVTVSDLATGREIRQLKGHKRVVSALALIPEKNQAVSASYDQTLIVWDLETGGIVQTLAGHTAGVTAVTVGKLRGFPVIVSAGYDGTIRTWNPVTGAEGPKLMDGYAVNALAVTPNREHVVSSSEEVELALWDLDAEMEVRNLAGENRTGWINALAVTADGQYAVSASDDETLKVWDLAEGRQVRTLKGHTGIVSTVAVTEAEGQVLILSGSSDKTIRVWDLMIAMQAPTNRQKSLRSREETA